jgi:hypothetical protein
LILYNKKRAVCIFWLVARAAAQLQQLQRMRVLAAQLQQLQRVLQRT